MSNSYSGQHLPQWSIIIPTRAEESLLEILLQNINVLAAVSCEILVVFDRQPSVALKEQLKKMPLRLLESDPSTGVSRARNVGLNHALGQNILLLDDDCVVPLSAIHQMSKVLQDHTNSLHGGSYLLDQHAGYFAKVYAEVQNLWLLRGLTLGSRTSHLLGGCLFFRRTLKDKVHFEEKLKWGAEEIELLYRLKKSFHMDSLWHRDIFICHHDKAGFKKFLIRAWKQGRAAASIKISFKSSLPYWPSIKLWPGLIVFFAISRLAFLLEKLRG